MNVVGLIASPSLWSRSTWLAERLGRSLAREAGAEVAFVTLRDLPAQALLLNQVPRGSLAQAVSAVSEADVVVLATTVERGSYSALLKAFLEYLPDGALRGKAVLPIVTGSSPELLHAVEAALAPVLKSLATQKVLPAVLATHAELVAHPTQGYVAEAHVLRQLDGALRALVNPEVPAWQRPPRIRQPAFAR